jgi:hypothetical protein
MKTIISSGFVATLLVASSCSTSGPIRTGEQPGGTWGGGGGAAGGTYGAGAASAAGGSGGTVAAGGLGGAEWLTPPTIPAALAVPVGATVKAHTHAVGSQIYTCTASAGDADAGATTTTYAFVLKAPDAKLFDADGVQVGTHGAGPSWTSNDGSVANGMKVAQVDAPAAGAIPWLLLRVSSTTGAGVFSDVTFVQRLNTVAGAAPATGCDSTTAGTDTPVGYSADYYFYVGGGGG